MVSLLWFHRVHSVDRSVSLRAEEEVLVLFRLKIIRLIQGPVKGVKLQLQQTTLG